MRLFFPVVLLVALVTLSGCKKKQVAAAPTAPPLTSPAPTPKTSAPPSAARVNPAPPARTLSTLSAEEEFKANVHDVFFDYDKANLRSDAQSVLPRDAAYLAGHPNVKVLIGGYCDERGSNEYNLSLGQDRADSVKKALLSAGIGANRVRVISYGKEKPFCSQETDACWQQNRRAGFSLDQ